jgi:chemotaxis protein CheX
MRIEFVNPIIDSAIEILSEAVSPDIKRGQISIRSSVTRMLGVAIIVSIAGDVNGRIIFDMDKQTAMDIASTMNGERLTNFDELTIATLTELANMISSMAITRLVQFGFQFNISPPSLFAGEKMESSEMKLESLVVPLELPQGRLEINVAIKES